MDIAKHIEERRKDKAFADRLRELMEKRRAVLDRLASK